ncbi:MAG: LysR family transcriptional regulator [Erysipelotrichaceae bacterium]|nr:LysR family transcriptional regulator [Erysipelotrichaceae bacterium]
MNIQDIEYITEIAESGSIGKAAEKLHVSQPSLSKCIRKIEQEYGIPLFTRVKGVAVKLTPEGGYFLEMAKEVLLSHSRFQEQIRRYHELEKNSLILGMTNQRTIDLADSILERFYRENPGQILQIQTRNSKDLMEGVRDRSLDFAVLSVLKKHREFYYAPIIAAQFGVYLREGSPLAEKAVHMDGIEYPVLRIEDLTGERFTANIRGSASRAALEELQRKNNVSLEIIDASNNQSRKAMVSTGIASSFIPIFEGKFARAKSGRKAYMIHPDQNIKYNVCLICLEGNQKNKAFGELLKVLKELM